MHQDASISIDSMIATPEMQIENAHLILRSERWVAICARAACRRTEIVARCISARDIAARSAEIQRATEGIHARQWACEEDGVMLLQTARSASPGSSSRSGQPRTRQRRLGNTRVPRGTATRWGPRDTQEGAARDQQGPRAGPNAKLAVKTPHVFLVQDDIAIPGTPHHSSSWRLRGSCRLRDGCRRGFVSPAGRVEEGAALEHRDEKAEQPIGDAAQCAAVTLAAGTEQAVHLGAAWVACDRDASPVVDGVA